MNLYLRLILTVLRSRRLPALAPWDTVATPLRVLPNDLDTLGHMNNGRYLTMMDLARTELMMRSGLYARSEELGYYLVVAGQTINYRRSLMPWQKFEIRTRMLSGDARAVFVEQAFVNRGTVCAHAVVRLRVLKKKGGTVSDEEMAALLTPKDGAGDGVQDAASDVPDWIPAWNAASRDAAKNTGLAD
ncbi:MAG: acyl-CoA thioesterase [Corynebacterium sp.]|uniref:acyl-CoA thioesterase n=1 Tax=Corynebacterium sp. TaxID=1720 RepID=UPI003F9E3C44